MRPAFDKVVILHGYAGSGANHWQTWLARRCRALGLETHYPKLPKKYRPQREEWLAALKPLARSWNERTVVVGHSLGCPTALQLLLSPRKLGLLLLVAPTSEPRIRRSELNFLASFYEGLDLQRAAQRVLRTEVLVSDNDPWVSVKEARATARALHGKLHVLPKAGHINIATGYHTLPGALQMILNPNDAPKF
jgi:predicted alpha/beta hydrolase family esterase